MAAFEDWKTPEGGPPSNSSSMESLHDNDEQDVEDNSSSSDLVDQLSCKESFASIERQVNGIRRASPCQTGMKHDIITLLLHIFAGT